MARRSNKYPALLTLLLVLQLLLPAVNVTAATNNMLPPSNVTSQFLAPENVKLSWSPVYGATGYSVYSIVYGQILSVGTTSTTSFTMNDLPEGSYSYVVSTLSSDGESGPGAPVNVDVVYPDMVAPATLTFTIQSGNNIVLNWGASSYAQKYNLYQIVDGNEKTLLQSGTARTYTVNNASEGAFTYAVSTVNSKYGESPLSTPVEVELEHPIMTAPGGLTYTVSNETDVTLKWNAVNYATNYKVYQVIDGQKVLKSTLTTTTVKYSGLPAGEHVYEVHSNSDRFGESVEGSQVTAVVSEVTIAAPINLTYRFQNINDVVLTWGSVPYANSYKVYQVIDGQKVLKSTQSGTTVTYTNQSAGDYTYVVHSYSDRFGESQEGSQVTLTVEAVTMTAPANFTYKIQNLTDVVLTWGAAPNANSYKVYQIIDGQKVLKSTITGTTVIYTNLPAGDYIYEVYSYSSRFGESVEGSRVILKVDAVSMTAPGNLAYSIQNLNDAVLTWDAAPNATGYKVYQIIDGQKVLKGTVTGTTVTYTNLPAGEYVYEIHSSSTRYGESQEGSRISFTMEGVRMEAPGNLSYKFQNGNDIILTWDPSANATNYKFYQIVNGQSVLKSIVSDTSTTLTNMPAGDYSYELHSNSTRYGESAEGSKVSFTLVHPIMLPPKNVIQTLKNATEFALNWEAADHATNYKVYQIVNGQKLLKKTVTGTTVSFTGMMPGDYKYTVHSYSSRFGESSEGTMLTFTMNGQTMQAPESLTYSLANVNDIVLKWTAVPYATTYKVYQVIGEEKVLKSTVSGLTVTYSKMPGGDYTYEVHSVSAYFGESPEGAVVQISLVVPTVAAPSNLAYKVLNGNDIVLNWAAAPNATSYNIYELINGEKVLKNTVSTLTVTFSNASSGDHTYIVHSVSNRFGESSEGSSLTFNLDKWVMQAPDQVTQTVLNGNDIKLQWASVTYATYYNVYQVVEGQKVIKAKTTSLTTTLPNMPEGQYQFEIHSGSTRFGESPAGGKLSFDLVFPVMQAPGTLTSTITNGNDLTLKWGTADYATAYKLYQIVDGEKVLKKIQGATSVTFSNMPEDNYSYVVHSYSDRFGESAEGSPLIFNLTHPTMQAPGNLTSTVANGNDLTLKWGTAAYATAYNLYQIVGGGEKVLKKTQGATSIVYPNMPEDDYSYVVHSYSDRFGESAEGSPLIFNLTHPTMQAPGTLTSTVTNGNDLTLKWGTAAYATSYKLYQIVDGEKVLKKTQGATSIAYPNMPEDDYSYVVYSYSDRFGESAEGSPVIFNLTHPTMQAPGNVTQTISAGNDITLKWGRVTYATAYKVYQVSESGKSLVKTQAATSVKFTNMPEDQYKYEIHSFSDRFGESPASGEVAFTLEWPVVQAPVLAASVFNANNITFSWPAVTWADEYRLYEVVGDTRQLLYKGTALTTKVYNLSETTHEYVVTAFSNRFGESTPSNRISQEIIYPEMQAPVASLTLLSDTSARIVWNFITYANGYNVYEMIDGKPVLLVKNLNNLSYTVSDLTYANHFYYVTSYSNSFGESTPSNEVEARLIVDTEPPITSANTPAGWVNQDAIVALSATDNETGVANSYYSVNDQTMVEGTTFTVSQEGMNKVTYYSVDRVGNKEEIKTSYVKVDKTAPVTTSSEVNEWSNTATLSLSATDALSGVAKTLYSVNGSEYMEGNIVIVTQEGINRISYYSIDQAGNREQELTVEVKIDRTAPVTTANAADAWANEEVVVTLAATDEQSGVLKTFYSLNGAEFVEGTSVIVTQEGVNEISFYSVDQAGNNEQAHVVEVKIDRTTPVTVSDAPAGWSNVNVAVNLVSTDAQSGVAKTLYSLNGAEFVEGTEIIVEQEGVNQISFYSVDQAGNMEQVQTVEVKIDRTAPVIAMSLNKEFMMDTTLQLNYEAKDNLSGIVSESMTVTGPNGTLALTNGTEIILDKPGVYSVFVKATNAAGLTSTIQKQFVVYIPAKIEVTPNVIKGNKGIFTVRVEMPEEYAGSSIDLETVTLNGVKALNSNNGYYNQAKNGQFKFERSDFTWTSPSVTLEFRGYVNGQLIIGQTTVKVQK